MPNRSKKGDEVVSIALGVREEMTKPCDELYRQWDGNKEPFGIPLKYHKFARAF